MHAEVILSPRLTHSLLVGHHMTIDILGKALPIVAYVIIMTDLQLFVHSHREQSSQNVERFCGLPDYCLKEIAQMVQIL